MPEFLQSTSTGAKGEPSVGVLFSIVNLNVDLTRRKTRHVYEGVPTLCREVGKPDLNVDSTLLCA